MFEAVSASGWIRAPPWRRSGVHTGLALGMAGRMSDAPQRRAAQLRETLFLIATQCERRPRARRLMHLLRQAEPELFDQVAADLALEDELALMRFLVEHLGHQDGNAKRLEIWAADERSRAHHRHCPRHAPTGRAATMQGMPIKRSLSSSAPRLPLPNGCPSRRSRSAFSRTPSSGWRPRMTDAIGEAFARRLVRRLLAEERDPAAALKAFVDAVRSSSALQDIVLGNKSPPFDDAHWAGYATAFMIRVVLEQRAELGMGPIEYPKSPRAGPRSGRGRRARDWRAVTMVSAEDRAEIARLRARIAAEAERFTNSGREPAGGSPGLSPGRYGRPPWRFWNGRMDGRPLPGSCGIIWRRRGNRRCGRALTSRSRSAAIATYLPSCTWLSGPSRLERYITARQG